MIKLDVKTSKNDELRRKTFKTTQNYESDQIIMNCIDLTSKRSKCWVTSQNILNNAKLQKWSNYHELHAFDIKTNENVALGRKPFKTTQNYKSDQNTMTCIDMMSKAIKLHELHRFDIKTNKNVALGRKPF